MALPDDDDARQIEVMAGIPGIMAVLGLLRAQTRMRFIGIARVTPENWIACAVLDEAGLGLKPGDQLDVNTTLCRAQLDRPHTIAFDDSEADPAYAAHPAPRLYGFRSHISVPILLEGHRYFGSLCALDPEPMAVSGARTVGMVEGMAALIGRFLDEANAHDLTKQALQDEATLSSSREQFLAVVAHDLRNPLSTMQMSSRILSRSADPQAVRMGDRLAKSAARMTGLINDLVDFSRGRAGVSMPISLRAQADVGACLEEVVQEARDAHPQLDIRSDIQLGCAVVCDVSRLQQLVSNLLGNAITYGAADHPITVDAREHAGQASIVVKNWGEPIGPDKLARVFNAYTRDNESHRDTSMGLGLHICQLIAQAHGGQLTVNSDEQLGTRFEMSWPSGC